MGHAKPRGTPNGAAASPWGPGVAASVSSSAGPCVRGLFGTRKARGRRSRRGSYAGSSRTSHVGPSGVEVPVREVSTCLSAGMAAADGVLPHVPESRAAVPTTSSRPRPAQSRRVSSDPVSDSFAPGAAARRDLPPCLSVGVRITCGVKRGKSDIGQLLESPSNTCLRPGHHSAETFLEGAERV
ncbi:hypothetical protein J1605_019643 [Eschrichtius robustus]|uniref:Uncharacterized protein n=1 Tax=Eschrichtius robustus TaxID=9764 RepID=A0AB34HPE1_ESCRO|nr:hypothetical protein J1605_019643 [Eschrichtius robustus]